MRGLRRAALAIGIGVVFAAALRLRGSGGAPPQQGAWRELTGPDLDGTDLDGRDPGRPPPVTGTGDAAPS